MGSLVIDETHSDMLVEQSRVEIQESCHIERESADLSTFVNPQIDSQRSREGPRDRHRCKLQSSLGPCG